MSKEQLKHIFEESACLTARQVKGYVTGKMVHEEAHAVEVHLLSCPFCKEAVEGLTEHKGTAAISAMEKLDAGFIAKHFGVTTQEIVTPKNTPPVLKAGSYSTAPEKDKPKMVRNIWKPMALAASLLAMVAVLWFMRDNIFPQDNDQLAQQAPLPEQKAEPVIAYEPPADSNVMPIVDTVPATDKMIPEEQSAVAATTEVITKEAKEATARKEADKKAADAKLAAGAASLMAKKPKEEIKPLPTAARQSSADALPRMGNSYTAPVPATTAPAVAADEDKAEEATVKKIVEPARTGLEKADDLFNKGKYRRALKMYQDEMGDTRSNRRDAATYMAARCHVELGEKMQARTLLNSLVNENSVKKSQAQQVLQQIGDE